MAKSKQKPDDGCLSEKEIKLLDNIVDYRINNSALSTESLTDLNAMRDRAVACVVKSDISANSGDKKKRKPSKYNLFIGDCMRGGGKDMKTCAVDYKKEKEAGKI